MRRVTAFVLAGLSCTCSPAQRDPGQPRETSERPVEHRRAAAQCILDFETCYKKCETDPVNYDTTSSGLGVPAPQRIVHCQENCEKKNACLPWQIGVLTGKPCRVSGERHECNFFLCSAAATTCLDDCFNVYKLTNPDGTVNIHNCTEQCYQHYGCRPHPRPEEDPCRPLPDGYVYCACPEAHGAACHPPGQTCP